MDPNHWPILIIAGYLSLLLGLGLFAGSLFKGTSKDYMVASHSIGPFLLLMSLFGTTMTAFALVGSTGEAYVEGAGVYGMLASSSGIIHSLCFLVLGVKLWSWGKRFGYTTQIQFFRDRLGSDKIGLLLFPILVGLVVPYLLIGVMASGGVINGVTAGTPKKPGAFDAGTFPAFLENGEKITKNDAGEIIKREPGGMFDKGGSRGGVPRQVASAIICLVVLVYVFYGGMRGTAWANTFQTLVFMVLGVVTFYIIATKIGGGDSFMESLGLASEKVPDAKLAREEVGEFEGTTKLQFFTYMLVPFSVGMFPHLFQHWLTAKRASSFKLAVVAHPVFIMIVWVPCVLVGLWATHYVLTLSPPQQAAITANQNLVLPIMVKQLAGPILGGFLTAGILAAIMSSLDSQFLAIGTMFTEDLVVHYGGKERFSDQQTVLFARGFIIAIVVLTYILSLFEPKSVFDLGVWCFSGFSSLFPLVLAAVYWPRLTKAGAYASILAAISTWIYFFVDSDFAKNGRYTVDIVLGGETYKMMAVAPMFLASTVTLVVVSLITPTPDRERLRRFFPDKIVG